MRISSKARNALRLMIDLADHCEPCEPIRLKEVADRQGISKRYLETVAVQLKNANLVLAISGRGGGYRLVKPPADISVGDIVRAIMGELNIVECVNTPEICPRSPVCPSRKVWQALHEQIVEVLGGYTLADLSEQDIDQDLFCQSSWSLNGRNCHGGSQ